MIAYNCVKLKTERERQKGKALISEGHDKQTMKSVDVLFFNNLTIYLFLDDFFPLGINLCVLPINQ